MYACQFNVHKIRYIKFYLINFSMQEVIIFKIFTFIIIKLLIF